MLRLTGGPFRYKRTADSYLDTAMRYAHVPVKQAVISPSALSLMYPVEEIPGYTREQFIADLLREHEVEVRACLSKGAHKVQIDFTEGRLAVKIDPSGNLLQSFIDLNNLALSRFNAEERMRIGVHTCPGGDLDSTHSAEVDYAELLPHLFELMAGNFYIALAGEKDRIHVLKIIRAHMKPNSRIFVGVVAPINPRIETPEEVRDRILEAADYIPVAQLGTTDDCGFSPFCDDTSTTRDTAFANSGSRRRNCNGIRVARRRLMSTKDDEEQLLRSVAQQNAQSINLARRRAEEALRKQSEWLQVTLSSIGDAVISTDLESRVTFMNRVAESLTGWSQAEALGRPLSEVFHILNEQSREPVENPALRALSTGTIVGLANHTILISRDGTEWPIDDSAAPIRNEQGEVAGVVLVFRDIRERRRLESERERLLASAQAAQKEAEQANRLKDEFLATASHELRTPLTAVVGWARLLRTGKLDAENSERALEAIERNATLQTKLIDDLLDVSRIITGKLSLDRRAIEMAHVVSDAVNTVRPAADAKNITIETKFDTNAGPVLGDANRLQQVVWNLLSNAVKFTPKNGRIEVALLRLDSQIEISVRDSGEGISSDFLPYVFDRFRQADGKTTRSHSGLGLGLAIVRQLVELHGGTVSAHSDGPGRGAMFTLRLPVLAIDRVPGSTTAANVFSSGRVRDELRLECSPRLDGVRVLIVDDDLETRQMLCAVLSQCNAEVITASSAAEALQEIKRRKPDVLVSDLGMPEQDGYELIRQVREMEYTNDKSATPALALTAYAKAEDRVRALAGGYQVHLSKPVEPAEFVLVVANLAGQRKSSG